MQAQLPALAYPVQQFAALPLSGPAVAAQVHFEPSDARLQQLSAFPV
jgi:hypothetical protein